MKHTVRSFSLVTSLIAAVVTRAIAQLACLAVLATPLVAHAVVIGKTDTGNAAPFGAWNWTGEYQQVYSSSAFSGSIDITSLTFYKYPTGEIYQSVNPGPFSVYLSITTASVGGLNPTLADNVGPDETLVYSGSTPGGSTVGGSELYTFRLSTPFNYDPSDGNLLLTVTNQATGPYFPETYMDADDSGLLMSRAFSLSGTMATTDSDGLVTGFDVTAVPDPDAPCLPIAGLIMLGAFRLQTALRIRGAADH